MQIIFITKISQSQLGTQRCNGNASYLESAHEPALESECAYEWNVLNNE